MAALAQYHRILEQRNVLLKSQRADDAVLEVLDLQLEQVSPLLYERRAAFVRDFIPLLPAVLYRYQWRAGSCEPRLYVVAR